MTSWHGDRQSGHGKCPRCLSLIFMRVAVTMCVVMVMSVVMVVVIRCRCVRRCGFVSPSLSSDSSRFPGFLGSVFCRGGLQPLGRLRWLQLFLVEVSAAYVCVHFMNMIVVMFMITVVAVAVIRVRLRRQVPVVNLLVFVLFIMCVIVIVVVAEVVCVMLMVILLYFSVIVIMFMFMFMVMIVIVIMFMIVIVIMVVIMFMFMLCRSSSGLTAPSGSSFCVWMLRVLFLVWTHLCGVTVPVALAVAVASVSG